MPSKECTRFQKQTGKIIKLLTVQEILDESMCTYLLSDAGVEVLKCESTALARASH
jgi:hypothetical protein